MPKNKKIKHLKITNLYELNVKDILAHIQRLYSCITKQKRQIKKLKLKIKKMEFLSKLDAHILKTEAKDENKQQQKQEDCVTDFINEIKNTAIMNTYEQAGFIYEPTSGLYWDSKTGYYYNPQTDLYYDGNKGTWHRLNPITNEFTFHSETEAAKAVKKVQQNSIDSLITDFKTLKIKNLQKNALGNEIEEKEAIKRIFEDNRQPLKCQEKLSVCDETKKDKVKKRYSSSDDSSDSYSKNRRRSRSRSRSRCRKRDRRSRSNSKTREDGELSDSSDLSDYSKMEAEYLENLQRKRKRNKKKKGNDYEEMAKKYPPSLRLMITESKVSNIPVGSLFLITYKGGSLGREGNHEVLLKAENVSKDHLRFTYNSKKKVYQFIDKSRNGTVLNGKEISLLKKEECEPQSLYHGDVLEIANIKLLLHIHEGLKTCDECEPYNYSQKPQEQVVKPIEESVPSLSHKEQLKLLQKRYGLESEKYQEKQPGTANKNYKDRASKRRIKVGSSNDHEKTVQASVDKSISSENKGFKLLSKMGWKEGTSLGQSDSGIKEPVQLKTQQGTSGLGNDNNSAFEGTTNKKKQEIWNKAQQRYNKIKEDE